MTGPAHLAHPTRAIVCIWVILFAFPVTAIYSTDLVRHLLPSTRCSIHHILFPQDNLSATSSFHNISSDIVAAVMRHHPIICQSEHKSATFHKHANQLHPHPTRSSIHHIFIHVDPSSTCLINKAVPLFLYLRLNHNWTETSRNLSLPRFFSVWYLYCLRSHYLWLSQTAITDMVHVFAGMRIRSWIARCALVVVLASVFGKALSFSPTASRCRLGSSETFKQGTFPPPVVLDRHQDDESAAVSDNVPQAALPILLTTTGAFLTVPLPAAATAGPLPSALVAYAHFLGILGVAGGLVSERFLIKRGLTIEEEMKINNADGVYGLSAFSLLISGYFRVTEYAKGWDFYKNEPLFWIKMASVAVLGGLSFYPAIIFFQRDQARQRGETLAPLSDPVVDRLTTIMNAEILALATIPLMATLMARGVFYVDNFPWAIGVVLYVLSLGGAGYKYGKEAFAILEEEKLLVPTEADDES